MSDEERKKLKVDMGQAAWSDLNSFRWEEEDVERKREENGGMTRYLWCSGRKTTCLFESGIWRGERANNFLEERSGRKGKAQGGSMSKLTWIARLYKQSWIKTYQKD